MNFLSIIITSVVIFFLLHFGKFIFIPLFFSLFFYVIINSISNDLIKVSNKINVQISEFSSHFLLFSFFIFFVYFFYKILKIKKCKFFLATGKNNEEQIILNEILDTKYRNFCVPLDKFSIRETLPIIKNCNLSICNDSSFSHLSAALGVKTITLMADTPLIYGNYSSNMFPILPDGEETVGHNTLGKEKINSEKIFNKLIEITN